MKAICLTLATALLIHSPAAIGADDPELEAVMERALFSSLKDDIRVATEEIKLRRSIAMNARAKMDKVTDFEARVMLGDLVKVAEQGINDLYEKVRFRGRSEQLKRTEKGQSDAALDTLIANLDEAHKSSAKPWFSDAVGDRLERTTSRKDALMRAAAIVGNLPDSAQRETLSAGLDAGMESLSELIASYTSNSERIRANVYTPKNPPPAPKTALTGSSATVDERVRQILDSAGAKPSAEPASASDSEHQVTMARLRTFPFDADAKIRAEALKSWPDSFSMQEFDMKQERESHRKIVGWLRDGMPGVPPKTLQKIIASAMSTWADDFSMMEYAIKKEVESWQRVNSGGF